MKNNDILINLIRRIKAIETDETSIMEVCGTHTQSISKYGLRELLYPKIKLISGPGCPVCVTSEGYIDSCIELLNNSDVIITTFGDLMKVKGRKDNLLQQRSEGKDVRVVYSPLDALSIAEENKRKQIVFLAIGFETTAPLIAATVKAAISKKIDNFSILSALKVMKPVIRRILDNGSDKIHGLICPGHVAVIRGAEHFKFITEEYKVPAVVCGFDELSILSGIYFLLKQQNEEKKHFKNFYRTCVTDEGNKNASSLMEEVFSYGDMQWRGIGKIAGSGLYLKRKFISLDASKKFNMHQSEIEGRRCVCSDIILGKKLPYDCSYFAKSCTPENAVGPCMVSSEGACSVYYKYGRWKYYG
ncbi:hydrogenase formation protein HypD [Clostridium oryzae]|uniref:Hydrogenase isoenzymes formation protein HypD n=1 Tax=Clostridium oryzae TaxID=1450648 RepID=A0A1V4IM68_9CLOT|nr:hydrogenase formation protein HypD [Clostridium oryzae]OPJ60983.1 hydrogenase isoenzymes formation protein HypD [Clostridium oryzae]